jgi:DNA-binding response OmpR family regulator
MGIKYLAIDKDKNVHEREMHQWKNLGVSPVRVDNMNEGIEKALENQFLYIAINADNVDYLPKLKILSDVTQAPILIGTSRFTSQDQITAINNGADFMGQFSDAKDNVAAATAVINRTSERVGESKKPVNVKFHGNILLAPEYHSVFINENNISLTKMEFDILQCLISNRGRVLSEEQIYNYIWRDDYEESISDIIKSAIKRLRQKIDVERQSGSYIENVRGVGYRIAPPI